jgi:hypothetical protein
MSNIFETRIHLGTTKPRTTIAATKIMRSKIAAITTRTDTLLHLGSSVDTRNIPVI